MRCMLTQQWARPPIEMAASKKTVQLFYDILSPYSWVAFEVLCRYRSRWNINLQLCPYFLSGIMKGSENRPPGVVPAKARYMTKDLARISRYFSIPLRQPANPAEVLFVKGSLPTQRFLTAVKLSCYEHLEPLTRQLWLRIWSRDEDIVSEESLREVCQKVGLSGELIDNLIGQIRTERIKEELKRTTQEALDLGAFGAPFIVAHMDDGKKETFFGSDRFELLADTIGEKWEGPLLEFKAKY